MDSFLNVAGVLVVALLFLPFVFTRNRVLGSCGTGGLPAAQHCDVWGHMETPCTIPRLPPKAGQAHCDLGTPAKFQIATCMGFFEKVAGVSVAVFLCLLCAFI